jgi:hypothetical protein
MTGQLQAERVLSRDPYRAEPGGLVFITTDNHGEPYRDRSVITNDGGCSRRAAARSTRATRP